MAAFAVAWMIDSLKDFVERQVDAGRYSNPDAFVADLVRTEAEVGERVGR